MMEDVIDSRNAILDEMPKSNRLAEIVDRIQSMTDHMEGLNNRFDIVTSRVVNFSPPEEAANSVENFAHMIGLVHMKLDQMEKQITTYRELLESVEDL
jgi:hypothetical protein